MTQEEILEGNELIAKFMGAKWWPKTKNILKKYSGSYEFEDIGIGVEPKGLLFHSSYNWIMQAVEKAESMGYPVHVVKGDVFIHSNNTVSAPCVAKQMGNDKKESLFKAIVQLIKFIGK